MPIRAMGGEIIGNAQPADSSTDLRVWGLVASLVVLVSYTPRSHLQKGC